MCLHRYRCSILASQNDSALLDSRFLYRHGSRRDSIFFLGGGLRAFKGAACRMSSSQCTKTRSSICKLETLSPEFDKPCAENSPLRAYLVSRGFVLMQILCPLNPKPHIGVVSLWLGDEVSKDLGPGPLDFPT